MRLHLTLALALTGAAAQSTPNPIIRPENYTSWVATSSDGLSRKALVTVPFVNASGVEDVVSMTRVDLVGDASQRGFAQGELLAFEIWELYNVALPKFFISMVESATDDEDARDPTGKSTIGDSLSSQARSLPPWLRQVLADAALAEVPSAFYRAMQWVWDQEASYVPPRLVTEMGSMARGVCTGLARTHPRLPCDVDEWTGNIQRFNMLPELIKMTCTIVGAWGKASASGNLLQLRALDFGASPFANYTVLAVHRPQLTDYVESRTNPLMHDTAAVAALRTAGDMADNEGDSSDGAGGGGDGSAGDSGELWQAFASVAFPGLVGAITGISEKGIGLSEKVWEVSNSTDGSAVQPGAYDGEADAFVMRDILELSPNRSAAEDYLRGDTSQRGNRTFAVLLGVGDYATQRVDIVGYRAEDFHAYTDETMPTQVTGQAYLEDVVYVDKHTQPSWDTSGQLPGLLEQAYGNLDAGSLASVSLGHETGDLHVAMYDYGDVKKMWVSVGRINAEGEYGPDGRAWKACFRPYLEFDLERLWQGQ